MPSPRVLVLALAGCLAVASTLPHAKWWPYRGDSWCAGEFEQCPVTGDCVLLSEYCGHCGPAQYLCPPTTNAQGKEVFECQSDFANCGSLSGTFWDTTLDVESRVALLVNATTTNEQIQQLQNQAPSIGRLYIPRYQWLNDDLHGLRGNWTTSFPNGNALGASFAADTLREVGRIIALEARAVHHFWTARGRRGEGWVNGIGLTAYAPNINLVRDPRWGRAQEVYGEDPFLTGALSEEYVRGMQHANNDGGNYLSAAACCKHFAAYDVENFPTQRYYYNAIVGGRDMYESYLPAFESCAGRADAAHVMCSYNSINGVPTCAEPRLLNTVLREKWGFDGFVVSDYDAWANIYTTHHFCPNMTCAAATGLNAGMDQEGGGSSAINHLPAALAAGMVNTSRIAQAFARLFRIRIKLGMFDAPSKVPLTNTSATTVASTAHVQQALNAARDAIGLYKNDNGALPLAPGSNLPVHPKIVLVGPKVTATRWLQGNYATPPVSGVVSIGEAAMNQVCPPMFDDSGILGATDLAVGNPVEYPAVPADNIAMCIALCNADIACNYITFYNSSKSCVKLPVDTYQTSASGDVQSAPRHGLVINNYDTSMQTATDLTVPAEDARQCSQRCRNRQDCTAWTFDSFLGTCALFAQSQNSAKYAPGFVSGGSPSKCTWSVNGIALVDACDDGLECNLPYGFSEAVRKAGEADAVFYVFGLDQNMESEGNDRRTIELPINQYVLLDLLRDAVDQGSSQYNRLIGVMVHGGTVAINTTSFDALLDAWYPGMQGGNAIVDVVMGRVNPAGRAAVTYYSSTSELPPNLAQQSFYPNASTGYKGLTYRYYTGTPVIPFGHGLSYTSFDYAEASISSHSIHACDDIAVNVSVANTGSVAGDEVVQVYVKQLNTAHPAPAIRLAGFARLRNIPAGGVATVAITVSPRFRTVIHADDADVYASEPFIEAKTIEVYVANGQPPYASLYHKFTVDVIDAAPLRSCPGQH